MLFEVLKWYFSTCDCLFFIMSYSLLVDKSQICPLSFVSIWKLLSIANRCSMLIGRLWLPCMTLIGCRHNTGRLVDRAKFISILACIQVWISFHEDRCFLVNGKTDDKDYGHFCKCNNKSTNFVSFFSAGLKSLWGTSLRRKAGGDLLLF